MSAVSAIASSINIPPRPEVLVELSREVEHPHPDTDRIAACLKRDVAMYGSVLRIVNSAAFNAGNVSSIERAILLLGLRRILRIAQVSALQTHLGRNMPIDRFWDTATEVAYVTVSLAQQYTGVRREDAYTVGLLHDFGIPLMMQAFPDFKGLLAEVNQNPMLCLATESSARYGFNHYDVGRELGKLWGLAETLNQAIYLQPQLEAVFGDRVAVDHIEDIKSLLALLDIAKNISKTYRRFWRIADELPDNEISVFSLRHLGLSALDLLDVREHYIDQLARR